MEMNSYVTLRKLTEPTEKEREPTDRELDATFQRMAELLEGADEEVRVQFQIFSGEKQLLWYLEPVEQVYQVRAERVDHPEFEIITKSETWWQIAQGSLSPLRAFIQGKMRVRGNIELGKRLLKQLASPEDLSDESRE